MKKPRLFLFGGFLGSGKTTLLVELGSRLTAAGASVAIITNDQGEYLVDTDYARSAGLAVGEVLKGCFCCNFTDFITNIARIAERVSPDYILAEPVGSCTDLTATVVNPFSLYHRELAELCGFYVLADGPRLLGEYAEMDLMHPVIPREVLISHQLKESRTLLLSKTDLLNPDERQKAVEQLRSLNPGARILACSAKGGEGLDLLAEELKSAAPLEAGPAFELDYVLYAEAEAEMGWYNGSFEVSADKAFIPADLAGALILSLKADLGKAIVHAKLLAATELGSLKLSLVSGRMNSDSALSLSLSVQQAACVLNVRAAVSPERICGAVISAIEELKEDFTLTVTGYREEALIPGPPRPTHRIDRRGNSL
jgi:G3E family GTPase